PPAAAVVAAVLHRVRRAQLHERGALIPDCDRRNDPGAWRAGCVLAERDTVRGLLALGAEYRHGARWRAHRVAQRRRRILAAGLGQRARRYALCHVALP